jgi:leucyl aminopeptidase (aminopeptidase T)
MNRHLNRVALFLVVCLLAAGALAPLTAGGPDFDAIADNLVNQSLAIQPGEVVLVNGNPDQIELLGAIQVAVAKAGGQTIVTLNLPEANKRAVMETPMEHLGRLPTAGLLLNRIADATISVGSVQDPGLFADVPEERLKSLRQAGAPLSQAFSNMRTRNVSLGQTGGIPTAAYAATLGADYKELSEMFWQAAAVSPEKLAARAGAVAGKLSAGAKVRLTSAAGSDLMLEIDQLPARINAGRTADVTAATGPSSTWLPAGEAYACVKPGSASGKLVVPYLRFRGEAIENLELTFEAGQMVGLAAEANTDKLRAYLDSTSDAVKELSIVDFGLNPHSRTPEGSHYQSWEMGGMVTLVMGNNTWAGGANHSEGALSMHVPALTATVNGEAVVSEGKLGI